MGRVHPRPIVVPGEEITTRDYQAVVAEVHARDGLVVAAHPVRRYQPGLAPVRAELDGIEVMHPIAFAAGSPAWRWADMRAYYEETRPRPAAIGSSDYHVATVLGLCRTLVFVREAADEAAVLDAVRAHRRSREPYAPRSSDYGYRGEGVLDRVLRLLGLAGGVTVIFVRPRAARTPFARKGPTR